MRVLPSWQVDSITSGYPILTLSPLGKPPAPRASVALSHISSILTPIHLARSHR
jgi:hypothetical protein